MSVAARRTRQQMLLTLALSLGLTTHAQIPTTRSTLDPLVQLREDILAATASAGVARATWGIVVHSIDRDERLFELNPGTLLVPASAVKLVSLASASEAVGWDYRFETTVQATVAPVNGTLNGDLVIVGSGDPTVDGRGGQPLSVWADALKQRGIERITGRVIGDDDGVEEPRPQLAWAWDDLGYNTGALFGALNARENQTVVTVSPGLSIGAPATISFDREVSRPIRNRTETGPSGSMLLLWPEQRPGEPSLTIGGSLPIDAASVRLPVSVGNPTAWFAESFRDALVKSGIEVKGQAFDIDDVADLTPRDSWSVVYAHRSPTLAEIAQPMLKESINLYAEAALRLNAAPDVLPTNDAALEGLRARLVGWGIPEDAWQIVDGSGLSRRNAVAPETLVAVLRHMYQSSDTSPWMTALPIAGRDGTLATRMRGTSAEGNVRAKSGTMTNVRTLAGYVHTTEKEALAFAIIANNFEGTSVAANRAIDRIAERLADFRRQDR